MRNKLPLFLSFTVLSTIPSVSFAETVNFSGSLSTSCVFNNNTAGTLGVSAINMPNGGLYVLDGGLPNMGGNGTPSLIDFTYTGAPTFTVNAVTSLTVPGGQAQPNNIVTGVSFTGGAKSTENTAAANSAGADRVTIGSVSFQLNSGATSDTANVGVYATSYHPWAAGSYSASTTVTCQ